jgi:hypothetical protein
MEWAYGMRRRDEKFIPKRLGPLMIYKCRRQNNIKMNLKQIEWDTVA